MVNIGNDILIKKYGKVLNTNEVTGLFGANYTITCDTGEETGQPFKRRAGF